MKSIHLLITNVKEAIHKGTPYREVRLYVSNSLWEQRRQLVFAQVALLKVYEETKDRYETCISP